MYLFPLLDVTRKRILLLNTFTSILNNLKLTTFARIFLSVGDIFMIRGGDIVDGADGIDGVME